jgi:tetratricopeptide (TPR) repeat protein
MPEAYASSVERLRAVAGTDRDPDGHVFAVIAEYLRRDGKLDEARDVLERGRQSAPDFASGHLVAAHVFSDLGEWEAARAALARLHELDSANTRAPALREALDVAEEEAAISWARAQGVGPAVRVEAEVVTVTLGELYLEQGEPGRAIDVAHQLLAEDPGNEGAQTLLERSRTELTPDASPAPTKDETPSTPVEDVVVAALAGGAVTADPEPTAVEQLAPHAVPVADLGPDPVPIQALAPDAVSVLSLAPTAVPIADLAPNAVGAADGSTAAARDESPDAAGDEGKAGGDMDDFMSWLDEH